MWVRFWHSYDRDNPPMDETDDEFQWFYSDRHDDDYLKEEALERVPSHCRYNDSGRFYYGFERLHALPESVRNRMIMELEAEIHAKEKFLDNVLRAGK